MRALAHGQSQGKAIAAVVLAVIAVAAIIIGVIYLTEPAKSLPSVLGAITSPASQANAHRSLRGETALVFGVACLVAAWFTRRAGRSSP